MKVSCYCLSYGRTHLLDEAVESFLRQECDIDRELLILNDLESQTLVFDHELVTVVNVPRRFRTLGEKINAAIGMTRGDVIMPWADDDIHLPWRISDTVERLGDHDHWRPLLAWRQIGADPSLKKMGPGGRVDGASVFTRTAFCQFHGYRQVDGTKERKNWTLEDREGFPVRADVIPLDRIAYIARWSTGCYHHSASNDDQIQNWVKKDAPAGRIPVCPAWHADYLALHRAAVATFL